MAQKITRRGWAATLATSTLASSMPSTASQAQTASAQETADELLDAARRQARRNQETLSKFPLPINVEPSSRFEA